MFSRRIRRLLLIIPLIAVMTFQLYGVLAEESSEEPATEEEAAVQEEEEADEPASSGPAAPSTEKPYRSVAESAELELLINDQGRVMVRDKRNNHVWRSTPDAASLQSETVKGHWRRNIESTFHLDYVDITKGETKLKLSNDQELKPKTTITPIDQGVEILHELESIESSIKFIIVLNGDHLDVKVPADGITEGENIRFINLYILPFLGAMQSTNHDGFMFVPDGMGAVIPFERNKSYPFGYTADVYGLDSGISRQSYRFFRNDSNLPVYGISSNQNAVFGVATDGDTNMKIHAYPSGLYTTYNWVAPQFILRNEYFRRTSSFGAGFNTYEAELSVQERAMRFYFLQGSEEKVNYVGMADAYRRYLIEKWGMDRIQPRSDHLPLDLYLFGADREPSIFGSSLVKTTTFDEARDIVSQLHTAGINEMDVTFMGWSNGGYMRNLPKRFPVEKALGGESGLSRLAEDIKRIGGKFYLDDNYVEAYSGTGFRARAHALRDSNERVIEERVFSRGFSFVRAKKQYWVQPGRSLEQLNDNLDRYKKMEVDGISHDVIGERLFSDGNPTKSLTRRETSEIYQEMLRRTKEELGGTRITFGNAYLLGQTDHISYIPLTSSYDLLARESVPFFPISIHGLISYSAQPGNLRDENRLGLLKSVEYGALPAYLLTYEDSDLLKDSYTRWIYSGTFANWQNTIVEEYQRMDAALADVQDSFIVNHRNIARGVYETTYENGKQIVVNYNDTPYSGPGIEVDAHDFAVIGGEKR